MKNKRLIALLALTCIGLIGVFIIIEKSQTENVTVSRPAEKKLAKDPHSEETDKLFSALYQSFPLTPQDKAAAINAIKAGADVNATGLGGMTPLHFAAMTNATDLAALLIQKDADCNAKDATRQTPLHWAASHNAKEVAELLINNNKIDVNAKNAQGKTPLDVAFENNSQEVAKLLKDHGGKRTNELPKP